MSSQRGNVKRTRPQKHNNVTAYKNNKHGETPKTKLLNNLQVCNVCRKCQDIIEWKIKFNKYKPLTAPAKCSKCLEKNIKLAYHTLCQTCAEKTGVCAKCCQKEEIATKPGPSAVEKARLESQFQNELKNLSERKRRTFLRYLRKKDEEQGEGEGNQDIALEEAKTRLGELQAGKEDDEDGWSDLDDLSLGSDDDEEDEDDESD